MTLRAKGTELVHLLAGGYLTTRPGHNGRGPVLSASLRDASHGAQFTLALTPAEARELAARLVATAAEVDRADTPAFETEQT